MAASAAGCMVRKRHCAILEHVREVEVVGSMHRRLKGTQKPKKDVLSLNPLTFLSQIAFTFSCLCSPHIIRNFPVVSIFEQFKCKTIMDLIRKVSMVNFLRALWFPQIMATNKIGPAIGPRFYLKCTLDGHTVNDLPLPKTMGSPGLLKTFTL